MVQHTHYPTVKPDPKTEDVRQRNAVVSYIYDQNFGVKGTVLDEFENLVTKFCSLSWEIDPHYYKLKSRGCSFPNFNRKIVSWVSRSHMATKRSNFVVEV